MQHTRHLIAALSAAYVNDDVGIAPLGETLLKHRLAGAEAAGKRRPPAPGDGKKGIENALSREQRSGDGKPLQHWPWLSHWPNVAHREFDSLALRIDQPAQRFVLRVFTARSDARYLAANSRRNQTAERLVSPQCYVTETHPFIQRVPLTDIRLKRKLPRWRLYRSRFDVSGIRSRERPQQAVEDPTQEMWAHSNRQRNTIAAHASAGAKAAGVLVHLHHN